MSRSGLANRRHAMGQVKDITNHAMADTGTVSSAYVPPLELTQGQPPPFAANGGLSYMSFDQDGDAGTAAAMKAALLQIAQGEGQVVIDMLENAPPDPSKRSGASGFGPTRSALNISGRAASKSLKAVWRCRFATPSTSGHRTLLSRPTHCGTTRRARPRPAHCARKSKTSRGDVSISRR